MALELDDRQRAMLQEMGVRVWLPESAVTTGVSTREPVPPPALRPVPPMPVKVAAAPSTILELDTLDWQGLAHSASQCQACGLCAGRKHSTLQAPPHAAPMDWFFVGDPPGDDDNRLGQPFAEQAGQLLDNMLKAMGARRAGVGASGAYVTHIVKCAPPDARLPQADELSECAAYLRREIALAQPKVIVAMGRFAIAQLLGEHPQAVSLPLGKQRGTVYRYQGIPVVVTYAPNVLLRASADKAKAWADLCLALDVRDGLYPASAGPNTP